MGVSLTRTVGVAAAVVGALFIASLTLLVLANGQLQQRIDAGAASLPLIRAADALTGAVEAGDEALQDYINMPRDSALAGIDRARVRIPELTTRMQAAEAQNPDQAGLSGAVRVSAGKYLTEYLVPQMRAARRGDAIAKERLLSGEGARLVGEIRRDVQLLIADVRGSVNDRARRAQALADLARWVALGAGIVGLLALAGLVWYLGRFLVEPLRRAAAAAATLGSGDFSVRLREADRRDEPGLLARSFNTMGENLERSTSDLEQVSSSLEIARHDEAQFSAMAEQIARATTVKERANVLVTRAADHLQAPVGTVYSKPLLEAAEPTLAAVRGVEQSAMPVTLRDSGSLAARALTERRTLQARHDDGELVIHAFGQEVSIRHEIHAPLVHGDETLGLLSLGRTGDKPFTPEEVRVLERQAGQGAVAFKNALEAERGQRLADLNRAVLDTTAEGIFLIDNENQAVISNPAMRQLLGEAYGVDPDEQDFETLTEAAISAAVDTEGARVFFEELKADPLAPRSYQYQVVQSGRARWIDSYIAPAQTENGELLGRVIVLRDITEQRQAEHLKDELMATVSHELRTPLSAILGFTELLRARDYPAEERKEYIDTVHEQAVRLSRLINDFLDLQRLQHAQAGVEKRPLNLSKMLADEAAVYDRQSIHHDVEFAGPHDEFVVRADPERLRRVIGNLLSNAIKYSPDGGKVRVELHREGTDAIVVVSDEGIGVPADARAQIFDRFYRVDSSSTRRIGGTGLGLALVREIVEAHGGSVGYDSLEGRGSRFWFRIPTA